MAENEQTSYPQLNADASTNGSSTEPSTMQNAKDTAVQSKVGTILIPSIPIPAPKAAALVGQEQVGSGQWAAGSWQLAPTGGTTPHTRAVKHTWPLPLL